MRHILAAIDFSDVTDSVIARAGELARAFSARLTLLHAATPDPEFVGYEVGPQTVRDSRARELREEHRDLENLSGSLRNDGIDAHYKLVMGPTVDTLLEEAEKLGCELIIIGSHGHGSLYNALVGSVAGGVLKHAGCPVLVIPDPKRNHP